MSEEPEGSILAASCAAPRSGHARIQLGHGGGGTLSAQLLSQHILPAFGGERLGRLEDQATLEPAGGLRLAAGARLAFTTDSFVVRPIFFPGGDIGRLAVHGTVNDLAVGGAIPRFLSAALILEEGLALDDLDRVLRSMSEACAEAGVELVTGDTKVVDRGKGDLVFITTSGVGEVPAGRSLSASAARPGDRVIVSGTMGDHGVAILSVREGLEFETALETDSAPLTTLTEALLAAAPGVRCMRDPTRGGLSSALNEIADASRVGVAIDEATIPVRAAVRGACEMLGLDPLYVANEGKLVAIVPPDEADAALEALRGQALGVDAAIIGEVVEGPPGRVTARSTIGGTRVVMRLAGQQLPRIC